MWTSRSEQMAGGRQLRIVLEFGGSSVAYAEVLRCWQEDAAFRTLFLSLLSEAPFAAFRWETPPITTATANRPFEFVLLDSPGLAAHPDANAFAEHFTNSANGGVIAFPNLGRDAILIVPCPLGPPSSYGHLAAFIREAPEAQKHALWERVGAAMQNRLGNKPVWLSTAGAGVSWLHVRLDDRPKYYGYSPYREANK